MTDDEIEAARDEIGETFDEVREDLSTAVDEEPVPDGGDE